MEAKQNKEAIMANLNMESMKYADLLDFVNNKGRDFLCTDEYKKTIYPILQRKYKDEGFAESRKKRISEKRKLSNEIKKSTLSTGVPVGLFL
jgi:hypothetical protein